MTGDTTRWWLVRHAPTLNPDRLVYGTLDMDVELPDDGFFRALAAQLPEDPVWITTPLRRSRLTLEAILAARGRGADEVQVEPDFAEQDFGAWEGLPGAEVWATIRQEDKSWPADIRPPGGESFSDVAARVARAAEDWSGQLPGRDVVAVIHSGSIRSFIALAMGGDPAAALAFVADPVSITRCDRLGAAGWRIGFVNRLASPPPR